MLMVFRHSASSDLVWPIQDSFWSKVSAKNLYELNEFDREALYGQSKKRKNFTAVFAENY